MARQCSRFECTYSSSSHHTMASFEPSSEYLLPNPNQQNPRGLGGWILSLWVFPSCMQISRYGSIKHFHGTMTSRAGCLSLEAKSSQQLQPRISHYTNKSIASLLLRDPVDGVIDIFGFLVTPKKLCYPLSCSYHEHRYWQWRTLDEANQDPRISHN